MAAVVLKKAEPSDPPSPSRNVLLRLLDALAEWLMRQELRIIKRGRSENDGNQPR